MFLVFHVKFVDKICCNSFRNEDLLRNTVRNHLLTRVAALPGEQRVFKIGKKGSAGVLAEVGAILLG